MGDNGDIASPQDVIQVIHQATRDELMSLKVTIGNRRIIVALCENDRGRFVKLTDGRSRIIVPSDGVSHMREALSALEANLEGYESNDGQSQPTTTTASTTATSTSTPTPPPPPSSSSQHQHDNNNMNINNDDDNHQHHQHHHHHHQQQQQQPPQKSTLIDSQRFLCEGRKFYFDVLENLRGRYLKISQASNRRITLIVSLNFIPYLKRAIDMVMEKSPPDTTMPTDPSTVQRVTRTLERVTALNDGSSVTVNVVQREIRVMGKRITFESAANRRGSYLKIMENNGANRMTIVLPHSAVPDVIQLLEEAVNDGDPAEVLNSPAVQNGQ